MLISQRFNQQGQWLFKRRGYLPIIILFAGLITLYFSLDSYGSEKKISYQHLLFVAIELSMIGMITRIYTVGYSAAFTSGRNTENQVADELNTSGSYSVVRHPLYLGNFIIYLGISILTNNIIFILFFILIFFIYYERIIYAEEAFLLNKFGKIYSSWCKETPAIIPALRKHRNPSRAFDWWKAFEREKSGIMSYFIVLFVFQVVRCFSIDGNYIAECGWAFGAGLVATAYYFTMKILSRKKILAIS